MLSDEDLKRLSLMAVPGEIRMLGKTDTKRLLVKLEDIERLIIRFEFLQKRLAHHLSPGEKLVWRREFQQARATMKGLAQFCRKNQMLEGESE